MEHLSIVLFTISAMLLGLLFHPVARKLHLPYPLFLVVFGFLFSELIVGLGFDTGIRHYNFRFINSEIFIPILVFAVAFSINSKVLLKNILPIIILVICVSIANLLITSSVLYYGFNAPQGFPWLAALISASLLTATNARAILDLLKQKNTDERLMIIIEGESLTTEVITIVLFNFFISMALSTQHASIGYWSGILAWHICGGLVAGILFGFFCYALLKIIKETLIQAAFIFGMVYTAFFITEHFFHSAGIITIFCMGLKIHQYYEKYHQSFIIEFWKFILLIATTIVFLLLGVTITTSMFSERWLAMIIAIIAITFARGIAVYSAFGLTNIIQNARPFNLSDQTLVASAGVRGVIAVALAFSIPETLDYWWTIQSIAFGCVVYTLLIQGPLMAWISHRYVSKNET